MSLIKTIKIHGILAKYFGNLLKLNISNVKQLINAIDCIKPGFRKKITELHSDGYNYSIIEDKNDKSIHLMPLICGSGKVGMYIAGAFLIVIGVVLLFFPGTQALGMSLLEWGLYVFIPMGLSVIISTATMKGPSFQAGETPQQYQTLRGETSEIDSKERSFIFENTNNIATQGGSVPLGYGTFKAGSQVVYNTVLNYDSTTKFFTESEIDFLSPPWFDYLAN